MRKKISAGVIVIIFSIFYINAYVQGKNNSTVPSTVLHEEEVINKDLEKLPTEEITKENAEEDNWEVNHHYYSNEENVINKDLEKLPTEEFTKESADEENWEVNHHYFSNEENIE